MGAMRSSFLLHPAVPIGAAAVSHAQPAIGSDAPVRLAPMPTAVMTSTNVATVNPGYVRFLNPRFRPPGMFPIDRQRSTFTLPTVISPATTPDDTLLFEDPQNPAHKFFLTDYAIAPTAAGAAVGKWVTFAPSGSGFLVTVHLADISAPAKVQGNTRLAPDTRYLITATVQNRVVSWDLTAAAPAGDGSLVLTVELADFAARDLLYAAMTDPAAQARLIIRRSLALALPFGTSGLFTPSTQAIDSPIGFTFDKDLDAGVFAGLHGMAATPLAPWKVLSLNWNGRKYTYYQSASQADQVYFLPDSFKVGRQATAPHLPNLAVTAQGDSSATMMLTLSYMAVPVWDPKRIAAAAPLLQQTLGLPKPPDMAVFEASTATLMLSLPGGDASEGAGLAPQSNVLIDLAAGVQGSITMALAPFRQLYEALFDPRGALMSGEVRVTVGDDISAVPFIARLADLAGNIFDMQVAVDSKANSLVVTLDNAIESPITISGLSGAIARGGNPVDGTTITRTSVPFPVTLPAGGAPLTITASSAPAPATPIAQSITVTMGTSTVQTIGKVVGGLFGHGGLFGGGDDEGDNSGGPGIGAITGLANLVVDSSCAPLFDLSQVTVTPDPKAMWKAIMANGAPSPVSRAVELKFLAASLKGASAAGATDAVVAVQVVFQSGQTASFDGSDTADAGGFMNQTVTLTVPIEAFVLQDAPTDGYTYRVDVMTPAGTRKGDWVTDNRDTIYIVPS